MYIQLYTHISGMATHSSWGLIYQTIHHCVGAKTSQGNIAQQHLSSSASVVRFSPGDHAAHVGFAHLDMFDTPSMCWETF